MNNALLPKTILSLLILCIPGLVQSVAQGKSDQQHLSNKVFELLKLKHQYDALMDTKRTNSEQERKAVVLLELFKSDYGKAVKEIKRDSLKYIPYLDQTISKAADRLVEATVNYYIQPLVSSDMPDRYVISKLDYLKAVRYSLFDRKADKLLHLYQIPGIKTKYPMPKAYLESLNAIDTSWLIKRTISDAEYELSFQEGRNKINLNLNIPKGFHEVGYSWINQSKFLHIPRSPFRYTIQDFNKFLVNSDSSILIGLKTTHTNQFDVLKNSIISFKFYVDSVGSTYHYLDKDWLKRFNTDFGVEYSARKALPFMDRFPNHRIINIAGKDFETVVTYFYTDKMKPTIKQFIKDNADIFEPIKSD